jgi:hypothetical protein
MNRNVYVGLVTVAAAIAFTAGLKMEPQRVVSAKDFDPVKLAPLCNVTNKFATEMKVEILSSKYTSGTYFIQPKEKGLFFCGDKVKVISGGYRAEMTIKNSIIFQHATPFKNITNI